MMLKLCANYSLMHVSTSIKSRFVSINTIFSKCTLQSVQKTKRFQHWRDGHHEDNLKRFDMDTI